jgi:small subunit ribosomal protein S13
VSEGVRDIVRLAGVDLEGSEVLVKELTKIKGVGSSVAVALARTAGIPEKLRVGALSEAQKGKLEELLGTLGDHVPGYLLNRRKDMQTGEDLHLTGSDLSLQTTKDIEFEKKLNTWKGIRHKLGLKVRGQRTKTSGRGGRSVGVSRKKIRQAAKKK